MYVSMQRTQDTHRSKMLIENPMTNKSNRSKDDIVPFGWVRQANHPFEFDGICRKSKRNSNGSDEGESVCM